MTKTKSTKRSLLMSALALLVCVSMFIGSTFAWFTDSVTSGKNVIQSGNLDIKLEYSIQENGVWTDYAEVTSTTDIFGYDNWEPGYTAIAKFRVTNAGSLALKYQLTADVYEEVPGVNVAGEEFLLSDYLYTEVVAADATREQILASTTGKRLKAPVRSDVPNTDLVVSARALEKTQSEEVALAIWMPTTVGNEANHNGTNQPSISFGINLIATQYTKEVDSFNDQYDVKAAYPTVAWASAPIDPAASFVTLDLLRANGSKAGFAEFPIAALDSAEENVTVKVVETKTYGALTIEDDQTAVTYEVTAEGVKEGNTTPIKVILNVGAGKTGVKLFHYNQEITDAVYDANDGNITFYTTSFSPFSVVYDAVAVEEVEEELDTTAPEAIVTDADEFENVPLDWTGWGGFNPADGAAQQLNSVYLFEAPHDSTTVQNTIYKDWFCDYYVMLETDKMSELPAGSITLGGNYGGYGWVGFDNPKVDTNSWIPLLGSVMGDGESGWTYADVVSLVKKFWCGVGVANSNTADLTDAKFVVELRLTNPEDPTDVKVANSVTYTFGPTVSNATGLTAAIEAGETEVWLNKGTYQLPAAAKGKTLTISGSEDAVIEHVNMGEDGMNYNLEGSTVTFNGVTIKTASGTYRGFARSTAIEYNNCHFVGTYTLGAGSHTFNNCHFNLQNGYVWTWGGTNVVFDGCTFEDENGIAKAILVHNTVATEVTVKDCTFVATTGAQTWDGIDVAAVSIDPNGANTAKVTFEGTNDVDDAFAAKWQVKYAEDTALVTVVE